MEKLSKGFSDGVEHYSNMVENLLDHVNKFNKEAKEAGTDFAAYVESINPLNKELKQRHDYENGCQYCKYIFRSDREEPCVVCSHNYTDKFKDDGTRKANADGDSN